MKILYHKWVALGEGETLRYFKQAGHKCSSLFYRFEDAEQKENDEEYYALLTKRIESSNFDCLFSWNYFPIDAQVCKEHNIPYISWIYDNPLNVNHLDPTLGFETNYVFCFDRDQTEMLKSISPNNVYHLPLAADVNRGNPRKITALERAKYTSDISFVGQLYPSASSRFRERLDAYHQGIWDAVVDTQGKVYGEYFVQKIFSEEYCRKVFPPDYLFKDMSQLVSYNMARSMTGRERLVLLALLSKDYKVSLYAGERHPSLQNVRYMGTADNITEAPKIFACSKINLNVTLRTITSGIPLRAIDVMSCGGMLLSNYQPELDECFNNWEDIVLYESIADAKEKVDYLLTHEEERKKIAANGYQKVKENFSYDVMFRKIWDTAGLI